jgi:hypothetical protein
MILIFMFVPMSDTALLFTGVLLSVSILMKFAPMGPYMTELYPTALRGTGQGFCYNAGRAVGSLFMTIIGFAAQSMPLGTAVALFSTLASLLMLIMLLFLPETHGREIAALEGQPPGDGSLRAAK